MLNVTHKDSAGRVIDASTRDIHVLGWLYTDHEEAVRCYVLVRITIIQNLPVVKT